MNINDVSVEIPQGDKLGILFFHQRSLFDKYRTMEEEFLGHPIPQIPFMLDDRRAQLHLKDMFWRVTEELAEASECFQIDPTHFLEEIIDAVHFFIETLIFVGYSPVTLAHGVIDEDPGAPHVTSVYLNKDMLSVIFDQAEETQEPMSTVLWKVTEAMGKAANCLKLKPWKQTPMMTDQPYFYKQIILATKRLFDLLVAVGFDEVSLTQAYLNKNAVNQFRIRSRY